MIIPYFIADCNGAYSLKSEWGTGQNGVISFLVPTATSECNVKITFNKDVKGIKVRNGQNENCDGRVCTFTHRVKKGLKKGQKLELVHRIALESPGAADVTDLEFNGEKICMNRGPSTTTSSTTDTIEDVIKETGSRTDVIGSTETKPALPRKFCILLKP